MGGAAAFRGAGAFNMMGVPIVKGIVFGDNARDFHSGVSFPHRRAGGGFLVVSD